MSRKVGIILTAIIAVIVGLWLWAGIIPKNSIQIGGSTSVSNVMTNLTNTYTKDHKGDSFIYSSVGSTAGVNSAESGTYKIGFISKSLPNTGGVTYVKPQDGLKPNANVDYKTFGNDIYNYFLETQKYDGAMHYVQIANDAIILAYDAPQWFKDNFSKYFDIKVEANKVDQHWKTVMQNIYKGGYHWSDVANDILSSGNVPADKKDSLTKTIDKKDNSEIQAYASGSGSGTRNSFEQEFGFSDKGADSRVKTHPSVCASDGFMFQNINNKDSFGYLSMNYLSEIRGKEGKNLKTALVNGVDPKDPKSFTTQSVTGDPNIKNAYSLVRPYIGLIKANSSKDDLKKIANFLGWIASASVNQSKAKDSAYQQYIDAGIAPAFKLDDETIPGAQNANTKKLNANTEMFEITLGDLKQTILRAYLPKE